MTLAGPMDEPINCLDFPKDFQDRNVCEVTIALICRLHPLLHCHSTLSFQRHKSSWRKRRERDSESAIGPTRMRTE